jgi:F-type H+-transporting ATPase subunit b
MFDWFTVGAQLLNFLVLIWLLKRFLYQPILNALDARERKISAELAAADQKMLEAQTEREEFQRKNQEFAQQRAELFKAATEEVKAERQRLLHEARQEADSLRAKRQEALQSEQQSLCTAISRRTQQEVFAIARKALGDLADANLEQQIVAAFIQTLQQSDNGTQQLLMAIKNSTAPLQVRTTFELSAPQKTEIEQAVQTILAVTVQLQFETAADLIGGIELRSDGQKISWSIADYLLTLEKYLNALLQPHVESKAQPEPKPESAPKS